jgi:hypothetical protein
MGINIFSHWLEDDFSYLDNNENKNISKNNEPKKEMRIMGCAPVSTKDWDGRYFGDNNIKNINPDPYNFEVKDIKKIGNYLWVLMNYPNCTEYNGDKILIYKDISLDRFIKLTRIDPHFRDSIYSPIARFKPDKRGKILSLKFCRRM